MARHYKAQNHYECASFAGPLQDKTWKLLYALTAGQLSLIPFVGEYYDCQLFRLNNDINLLLYIKH